MEDDLRPVDNMALELLWSERVDTLIRPCATSARGGQCRSRTGAPYSISSSFCSTGACRWADSAQTPLHRILFRASGSNDAPGARSPAREREQKVDM